jgi:hypothetical protein
MSQALAAAATAERQWLGDVAEFRAVVGADDDDRDPVAVDWDAPVFFDPPSPSADPATRWEGALHVRAMPPKLEKEKDDRAHETFAAWLRAMDDGGDSAGVWSCAADHARAADKARPPAFDTHLETSSRIRPYDWV